MRQKQINQDSIVYSNFPFSIEMRRGGTVGPIGIKCAIFAKLQQKCLFICLLPEFLPESGPTKWWCASTLGAALLISSPVGSDLGLEFFIIWRKYGQLKLLNGITKMNVLAYNYHTNGTVLLIFFNNHISRNSLKLRNFKIEAKEKKIITQILQSSPLWGWGGGC